MNKSLVIAVDYDQTCRAGNFPHVYEDIGAARVLKKLVAVGHKIILYTLRCDRLDKVPNDLGIEPINGLYLTEAINWFADNGIPLYGVNAHPLQKQLTDSPKCWADIFIDDRAIGTPLLKNVRISNEHYVNWYEMEELLTERDIL